METARYCTLHLLLPTANHRRPQKREKNVRAATGESMARLRGAAALKSQTVAIMSSMIVRHRFQVLNRVFCATNARSPDPTFEEARDKVVAAAGEGEKADEVKLPPPPERPLPGDCCGSGCTRCVWDVYHEELQAYKDLIDKAKSSP
ncbi:hypothetical protein SAY87_005722 [Trapa incisa]|uniref:Oxidoreductase-like domain-containing protein n=1 Tax=Trapa incisa TaxID=236973 RepID=A0AAN7K9E6_9MYRT|nr:hypothetical protein SAY87_005722 [Trapa incisa]